MKKLTNLLAVFMSAAMIALLAAPAFAGSSYAPNGIGWGSAPSSIVQVRKVDPSSVVKDGEIGEGEYGRLDVDLGEETSPLMIVAFNPASYDNALSMLPTMEYYFSWDEVHGFNFAIRNKPVVVQQLLETAEGDSPQDDFARNTAYVINFKTDDGGTCLFYALAKRTDDGRYLEGYYTGSAQSQLGVTRSYDPEEGVDYVISYGDDGYVTVEWSIPLENFFVNGGEEGSKLEGTVSATAGTAVTPFGGHDKEDSYAITLGDFGYGVDSRLMRNHVVFRLSGDSAPGDTGADSETAADAGTGTARADNPSVEDLLNLDKASDSGTRTWIIIISASAVLCVAAAFIILKVKR